MFLRPAGLHKLWYPGIRDTSTWSKFGAHGEHGDVFLLSNLGALWFSENLITYSLHICLREVNNNFFPFKHSFIYGISRDGSKKFNLRTCEHMIPSQLRIWARTTTYAALCSAYFPSCIFLIVFFSLKFSSSDTYTVEARYTSASAPFIQIWVDDRHSNYAWNFLIRIN